VSNDSHYYCGSFSIFFLVTKWLVQSDVASVTHLLRGCGFGKEEPTARGKFDMIRKGFNYCLVVCYVYISHEHGKLRYKLITILLYI
jgi:hypothetical protein